MPPPSRLSKSNTQDGKKSAKRKAEAISSSTLTTHNPPTQSGFTISSLPQDLTQSTPKPPPTAAPPPSTSTTLPSSQTTTLLSQSHSLTTLSVISSTQITKRVSKVLNILSEWPATNGEKERVVMLYAKGDAGGKLISVVEIVKRDVAGRGGKWFQYNAVEGRVEEISKKKKEKDGGGKEEGKGGEEGNGEEEAFEVMKTPFERAIEGRPKVREVPVLIVYLSRVRIEVLRKKYGEQTNAEPAR